MFRRRGSRQAQIGCNALHEGHNAELIGTSAAMLHHSARN
jgi:hypothetical protein